MHKNAASIITSHKSAASRVSAHLLSTRHLKMSPSAALELVACVLNDSNWQTLLGMAEQGKSPLYPEGKPKAEKGIERVLKVTGLTKDQILFAQDSAREASVGSQLEQYYAAAGEHPMLKHEDWSDEFEEHNTRLEYWPWVAHQMDNRGEMMPWDRDANTDVDLAIAAGVVAWFDADKWFAVHGGPVCSSNKFDSEDEFWDYASSIVSTHMQAIMAPGVWSDLLFGDKLAAVKKEMVGQVDQVVAPVFQPVPDSEGPFDIMLDGRQYGQLDDFESACAMAKTVAAYPGALGHLVAVHTNAEKYAAGFMDKKTQRKVFLATTGSGGLESGTAVKSLCEYLEMNWDEEESFETRREMLGNLLQQAQLATSQKHRGVVVGYQEFEILANGRVVTAAPPMEVVFYVTGGVFSLACGLDPDVASVLRGGVF